MALPKYTLNTRSFFAPLLLEAGTTIEWEGVPGPHMDPVNQEAVDAMAAYYTARPEARLTPEEHVEQAAPTLNVVSPPDPGEQVITIPVDPNAPAAPGLSDGGKAK